jgi:integrase
MKQELIKQINQLNEYEIKELRKEISKKSKYKKKGVYREKENSLRFFNPDEWENFVYSIKPNSRNYYWFLMLTGLRYNEAKHVKISHIDFVNKQIIVMNPKGRFKRHCQISSYALKLIKQWIKQDNIKRDSTFDFPTIQHLSQLLKRTCKNQKIANWQDFSIHNLRKTHENYLLALNLPEQKITSHMGHTSKTANEHYISSGMIKNKEQLDKIRRWLGDIFG